MPVQVLKPAGRPDAGEEFHPISVRMVSDYTEVFCEECGTLENAGHDALAAVAHGADHAISTGHTVTEKHVKVTVISERRVKGDG